MGQVAPLPGEIVTSPAGGAGGQQPGQTDPLTLALPQLVPLHLKQGAVVVKYGLGGASAGRNCN
jgi:hypothetical protein